MVAIYFQSGEGMRRGGGYLWPGFGDTTPGERGEQGPREPSSDWGPEGGGLAGGKGAAGPRVWLGVRCKTWGVRKE